MSARWQSLSTATVTPAATARRALFRLLPDRRQRQRARGARARRVIGDRDVLVAERAAGGDHRLDRIPPVAPRRMHVQIAADVLAPQQRRQLAVLGELDLGFA